MPRLEKPTAHSVITGALYNSIVRRTGRSIGFGEADKIAGDIMASLVYADFKVLDDRHRHQSASRQVRAPHQVHPVILLDWLGIGECRCSVTHRACITCGRTPGRHKTSCLCQDFREVCRWCAMRVVGT